MGSQTTAIPDLMGRPKRPPTTHVRIRIDMAEMLEIVAAQKKKDIPELLDELFRPLLTREYKSSVEQLRRMAMKMRELN